MTGREGRVLGIIGLGNTGRAVARAATALRMRVIGCKNIVAPVEDVEQVWEPDGLPELLSLSDFVLVSTPLTSRTRGLLEAPSLPQ